MLITLSLMCCINTSRFKMWLTLRTLFLISSASASGSSPTEMRHPVSNRSTAFRDLFTSGIKSAYDIETSGWMKLSQCAGTAATHIRHLKTTTTKMNLGQWGTKINSFEEICFCKWKKKTILHNIHVRPGRCKRLLNEMGTDFTFPITCYNSKAAWSDGLGTTHSMTQSDRCEHDNIVKTKWKTTGCKFPEKLPSCYPELVIYLLFGSALVWSVRPLL